MERCPSPQVLSEEISRLRREVEQKERQARQFEKDKQQAEEDLQIAMEAAQQATELLEELNTDRGAEGTVSAAEHQFALDKARELQKDNDRLGEMLIEARKEEKRARDAMWGLEDRISEMEGQLLSGA